MCVSRTYLVIFKSLRTGKKKKSLHPWLVGEGEAIHFFP